MERTGRCLCGAIRFTAKGLGSEFGACHCGMCRRWSGGPLLALQTESVEWSEGEETLQTFKSSPWAERAFCPTCGTNLFYRVTAPGPHQGAIHLALGTLDDQSGMSLSSELFIDIKPEGYAFEGEHRRLTEAEVMAMYGGGSDG